MPSQTNLVNGCEPLGTRQTPPVYFFKLEVSTKVLTPRRLLAGQQFIVPCFPRKYNDLPHDPVHPCSGTDYASLLSGGHDGLPGRRDRFGPKDSKEIRIVIAVRAAVSLIGDIASKSSIEAAPSALNVDEGNRPVTRASDASMLGAPR